MLDSQDNFAEVSDSVRHDDFIQFVNACDKNFELYYKEWKTLGADDNTSCVPISLEVNYKNKKINWPIQSEEHAPEYFDRIRGSEAEQLFFSQFRKNKLGGVLIHGLDTHDIYNRLITKVNHLNDKMKSELDNICRKNRSEIDFLLLHQQMGIIIIECKAKAASKARQKAEKQLLQSRSKMLQLYSLLTCNEFVAHIDLLRFSPDSNQSEFGSICEIETGEVMPFDLFWERKLKNTEVNRNYFNDAHFRQFVAILSGYRKAVYSIPQCTRWEITRQIDEQLAAKEVRLSKKKSSGKSPEKSKPASSVKEQQLELPSSLMNAQQRINLKMESEPVVQKLSENNYTYDQYRFELDWKANGKKFVIPLNAEQQAIINGTKTRKLSFIFGSPGSGKTLMLMLLALLSSRKNAEGKVLVLLPNIELALLYKNFFEANKERRMREIIINPDRWETRKANNSRSLDDIFVDEEIDGDWLKYYNRNSSAGITVVALACRQQFASSESLSRRRNCIKEIVDAVSTNYEIFDLTITMRCAKKICEYYNRCVQDDGLKLLVNDDSHNGVVDCLSAFNLEQVSHLIKNQLHHVLETNNIAGEFGLNDVAVIVTRSCYRFTTYARLRQIDYHTYSVQKVAEDIRKFLESDGIKTGTISEQKCCSPNESLLAVDISRTKYPNCCDWPVLFIIDHKKDYIENCKNTTCLTNNIMPCLKAEKRLVIITCFECLSIRKSLKTTAIFANESEIFATECTQAANRSYSEESWASPPSIIKMMAKNVLPIFLSFALLYYSCRIPFLFDLFIITFIGVNIIFLNLLAVLNFIFEKYPFFNMYVTPALWLLSVTFCYRKVFHLLLRHIIILAFSVMKLKSIFSFIYYTQTDKSVSKSVASAATVFHFLKAFYFWQFICAFVVLDSIEYGCAQTVFCLSLAMIFNEYIIPVIMHSFRSDVNCLNNTIILNIDNIEYIVRASCLLLTYYFWAPYLTSTIFVCESLTLLYSRSQILGQRIMLRPPLRCISN